MLEDDVISFMDCSECDLPIVMEELPVCSMTSSGAVSVEWKSRPHHGSQVVLMGFVTVAKLSYSSRKDSSTR